MQLRVDFQGNGVNLPIAYRHTQQGMIYQALVTDQEFASMLHDNGYETQQRKYKLFTFSPFSGVYSTQNKRIIFQDSFSMEIRSFDPYLIHQLEKRFISSTQLLIANNPVTVINTRISNMRIQDASINIQTISPIVAYQTLEDGHTRFFTPEDPAFISSIIQNAKRKWNSIYGETAPIDLKVQLIPNKNYRKVPTVFKGTFITGWHCALHLSGYPEVLDMLYQTGLGAKSSQGFGMFRITS